MQGVEVYRSYQRGWPKVVRPNVERWVAVVRDMFRQYMRAHGKPDVLHAHCAKWAGYAAMLIGREHGIPYVITEHMPLQNYQREFGPAPSKAWQIPLLKEAYRQAAMVISVSEELTDDIACYFGRDYRWTFVSNVIDTDFFHYREREQRQLFRFVCPAIFTWRKGYDVLLAAFDKMEHREVELHVAGQGTDSAAFRRLLATCGSAERVVAHGPLDRQQMRNLLWQCDCVALATRGEVQPLSLLEALSTGIPYVSTTVVPRNERFDGAGIVVPVDDTEAFARAMDSMVETKVDGRSLSGKVQAMASANMVGGQIEKVLQTAISAYVCKTE